MNFNRSNYRDQGVHSDSQSEFSDRQPGVGTEREEQQTGLDTYGSWDAGSQAHKISTSSTSTYNSKSETFMSPYGDYDMDDSSFFAHTTRLNIVGPKPNSTQLLRRRSSSTERFLTNCGERSMATTAFSFHRSDRPPSRLQSPPVPPVPEKRTSPTESYLELSLQSSLPLANPTASRKLLVLDLNGTLLLRSAYRRARPSYSYVSQSGDSHPFSTDPKSAFVPYPVPALRTIYPRPYIPSFCAYIFHPATLQWLDTMVWSSAQPHSVNDMVDKCFGPYKESLKAIWARDTLGLSSDEYHKKTQTVKDLARTWANIPSLIPNLSHAESGPENVNSEVDADGDNHSSVPQQQQHSALTTILMDDSHLKAVLQPWNHLCVSEYDSERRRLDVEIAEWEQLHSEREQERTRLAEREHVKENVEEEERTTRDGTASDEDMVLKSSEKTTEVEKNKEEERKRKRKEKKLSKKEKLLLAEQQQLEVYMNYDELLLAVVGILDALKHEGNVAGWMRSGGLVHVGNDQETILETPETEETPGTTTTMKIPIPNPQTTLTSDLPLNPKSKRGSPTISIQGPSKRRKLTQSRDMESDPPTAAHIEQISGELDSDSEMAVLSTTPTMSTNKRRSLSTSPVPSSPSPPNSSSSPLILDQVKPPLMGSLVTYASAIKASMVKASMVKAAAASSTTTVTPKASGNDMDNTVSTPIPIPQSESQPLLWYETPCILFYWAQRGRKALAELGIDIIHGVALQY